MKLFFTAVLFLFLLPFHIHAHPSNYEKWLAKTTLHLDEKGRVIHTELGDIQIVTQGKGPVVLAIHGGFGGWDQGLLVASKVAQQGYKVISVSRPGYLSTPIATNPLILEETDAAQQADLLAALLKSLCIPKALLIGFSAGAPVAYEFGLRHPEMTNGVVLESIGANPNEDGLFYSFLGIILSTETENVDFVTYLLHLGIREDFYSVAKQLLPADTTLTGKALAERTHYVLNHRQQSQFFKKMLKATIPISPRLLGTLNDFLGVDYWTDTFTPPTPQQYSLPTLIIQAINDSNGFYPTAQVVNTELPTSKLISVEESGHFIWLGPNTNAWEKELFRFLKAHSQ